MPRGRFAASFDSPTVDVIVDFGNPILNYTLDGFIKVGGVKCFFLMEFEVSLIELECFRLLNLFLLLTQNQVSSLSSA
jgi:hypothetical protein